MTRRFLGYFYKKAVPYIQMWTLILAVLVNVGFFLTAVYVMHIPPSGSLFDTIVSFIYLPQMLFSALGFGLIELIFGRGRISPALLRVSIFIFGYPMSLVYARTIIFTFIREKSENHDADH